jgi:hypothetical protein
VGRVRYKRLAEEARQVRQRLEARRLVEERERSEESSRKDMEREDKIGKFVNIRWNKERIELVQIQRNMHLMAIEDAASMVLCHEIKMERKNREAMKVQDIVSLAVQLEYKRQLAQIEIKKKTIVAASIKVQYVRYCMYYFYYHHSYVVTDEFKYAHI